MNKIKSICLIFSLLPALLYATSVGTDFFVCYPANACREPVSIPAPPDSHFNGQIIITSTSPATGIVRNEDSSFCVPFSVPAYSVITISIDSTHWIRESDTVVQKGLRIQSDNPISVFFLSYEAPSALNDIALIYPVPSLGTDYITMCWRDNLPTYPIGFPTPVPYDRGPSMFAIVAPYDSTHIEITTPVATEGGHPAGVPWSIVLNSYDCYQVLANTPIITDLYDLTGSVITSDKPIAVLSGNQLAFVPDSIMAADYLIEQMPPLTAWGTTFNLFPIQPRNYWGKDVIKILASEDGTNITIEDSSGTTPVILNRGESFEWNGQPCNEGSYLPFVGYAADCDGKLLDSPTRITSDKPILIGQFITGGNLTRGVPDSLTGLGDDPLGDPAFMLVPPVEQYAHQYVFLTPSGYNNDFVNIAILAGYEASVMVDGGAPVLSTPWFDIPTMTYRGARISLDPGAHVIEADTNIMLQMYGYDENWASYATVVAQNLDTVSLGIFINRVFPEEIDLFINPNPFNSFVSISAPKEANIEIFDMLGKLVVRMKGGNRVWKPEASVGSGIYLVRARVGDKEVTKRVVYLK